MAEVIAAINGKATESEKGQASTSAQPPISGPIISQPLRWQSKTHLEQVQDELAQVETQAALLKPLVAQYVLWHAQRAESNFAAISSIAYGLAYAKLHREHGAAADLFITLDLAWDKLDFAEQQKLLQAAEELTRLQRVNLQLGIPTAGVDVYSLAATKTGEEAKDLIRVLQAVANYGADRQNSSLSPTEIFGPARSNLVSVLSSLEKRHRELNEQLLACGQSVRCCLDLEDALFYVKNLDQELVNSGERICKRLNGGNKPASLCFTGNADSLVFVEESRERNLADRQFVCSGDLLRQELAGIYEKLGLLQGRLSLSLNDIPISEELKTALGISSGLSNPMARHPMASEAILLGVLEKDLSEQIDRIALLEPGKRKAAIDAFVRSITGDSANQVATTEAIGTHVAHPVYRVLGGWGTVGSLVGHKNELAQLYFDDVRFTGEEAKKAAGSGNFRQALALLHRIHGRLEGQRADNWSYNRFHQQLFLDTFMLGLQTGMSLVGSVGPGIVSRLSQGGVSQLAKPMLESEARQALNSLGIRSMPRNFWVTNSSAARTGLRIHNPPIGEAAGGPAAADAAERSTIPFRRETTGAGQHAAERVAGQRVIGLNEGGPARKLLTVEDNAPAPFRVVNPEAVNVTHQIGDPMIPSPQSLGSLPQLPDGGLVLPKVIPALPWTLVMNREPSVTPVGDGVVPPDEGYTLPIMPNALPGTFEWYRQQQLQDEYNRQKQKSPNTDPSLVRASGGGSTPASSGPNTSRTDKTDPERDSLSGASPAEALVLDDAGFLALLDCIKNCDDSPIAVPSSSETLAAGSTSTTRRLHPLAYHYGFGDNLVILLRSKDRAALLAWFNKSGLWVEGKPGLNSIFFHLREGGVAASVNAPPQSSEWALPAYLVNCRGVEDPHTRFQTTFFDSDVILIWSSRDLSDRPDMDTFLSRQQADAVAAIGSWALQNHVPMCFPESDQAPGLSAGKVIYYFPGQHVLNVGNPTTNSPGMGGGNLSPSGSPGTSLTAPVNTGNSLANGAEQDWLFRESQKLYNRPGNQQRKAEAAKIVMEDELLRDNIEVLVKAAKEAHDAGKFDVAIISGNSGFILTEALTKADIPFVEIGPLRKTSSSDIPLTKLQDAPVGDVELGALVKGRKVVLLDDQLNYQGTLAYTRAKIQELGGLFIGVGMYRDIGEIEKFLRPSEFNILTGKQGSNWHWTLLLDSGIIDPNNHLTSEELRSIGETIILPNHVYGAAELTAAAQKKAIAKAEQTLTSSPDIYTRTLQSAEKFFNAIPLQRGGYQAAGCYRTADQLIREYIGCHLVPNSDGGWQCALVP